MKAGISRPSKAKLLGILLESDRDGEACILLSEVSRELEEVEEAVDYGLKAVTLLPESAPAHLSYAKALSMQIFSDMQSVTGMIGAMARMSLFKEEIELVIALDPDDTEARSMLVFYHMAPKPIGDIDKAIELCHEIERLDPVSGRQLLAMCYRRKEEPERAVSILLAGIEEYPEERGLSRIARGHLFLSSNDLMKQTSSMKRPAPERRTSRTTARFMGRRGCESRMSTNPSALSSCSTNSSQTNLISTASSRRLTHAGAKATRLSNWGEKQEARDAYEESLRREPGLKLAKEALEKLTD